MNLGHNKAIRLLTTGLVFSTIFFSIFGPKIGLIDSSLLSSVLGLGLIVNRDGIYLPRELRLSIFILLGICAYSLIIIVVNGNNVLDFYLTFRNIRIVLSTTLLGIIFSNFKISITKLLHLLILVLLINSLVIILQVIFPQVKIILGPIVGYDKLYVPLRAFGLTSGYDGAGYLCLFGFLLSSLLLFYNQKKCKKYLLSIFIFLVSSLFVSRLTIMLMFIFIALLTIIMFFKGRLFLKVVSLFVISFGLYSTSIFILPLLAISTSFDSSVESKSKILASDDFKESYGGGSGTYRLLTSDMLIFPESNFDFLFGSGSLPFDSDIGYVKLIFMIGIIGLSITSLFYFFLFYKVLKIKFFLDNRHDFPNRDNVMAGVITFLISIILLFVYNYKNLFFLSRTFYELTIILFFSILRHVNTNTVSIKEGRVVPCVPKSG